MGFYKPPGKKVKTAEPPGKSTRKIPIPSTTKATRSKRNKIAKIAQGAKTYVPEKHQKRAIDALLKNKNYGLLFAPGRGKTGIVIETFRVLKKKGKIDTLVVFAKKKIIMSTWPREFAKWGCPHDYHIAHGPKKSLTVKEDIILVNYEGLSWFEEQMLVTKLGKKKRIWGVLDESTRIKNTDTERFQMIKVVAPMFDRRTILTGSFTPKNLIDIFAQIYYLDLGESLGQYITHFRREYFNAYTIKVEVPGRKDGVFTTYSIIKGKDKVIFNKIKHLIMRLGRDDNLPPLKIVDVPIILSPKARKAYDELDEDYITRFRQGVVTAANAGTLSMRLRQMTGGSIYDENKKSIHIHNDKLDALENIIDELQGSPCLVAYHFIPEAAMILKRFKQAKHFHGKLNSAQSIQMEDDWNAGKIEVFVGQISTIAHGLNLQESGNHLVMYSMDNNLEDYEQLWQRLLRFGQKKAVILMRLIAENTIDETIIRNLSGKDRRQKNFLELFAEHYKRRFRE